MYRLSYENSRFELRSGLPTAYRSSWRGLGIYYYYTNRQQSRSTAACHCHLLAPGLLRHWFAHNSLDEQGRYYVPPLHHRLHFRSSSMARLKSLYFRFSYNNNNNGPRAAGISENSICHLTPAHWAGSTHPFAAIIVDCIFVLVFPRLLLIYMFSFLYSLNAALPGHKSKIAVPALDTRTRAPWRRDYQCHVCYGQ